MGLGLSSNNGDKEKNSTAAVTTMGFSAVLFLLTFLTINTYAVTQLEYQLLSTLAEFSRPWLDVFFSWATLLGDFNVLCPVVVLCTLLLLYKRQFKIASVLCVSFFGAALSTLLLKAVMARARPDFFDSALQHLPINAAFPSAHTTHATALALFLAWLALRRRQYFLLIPAGIIATLVAISRVYLQVHWPTDLLGGIAVSLFWLSFAVLINGQLFNGRKQHG
jgi:undecaprenyl-diphosphatase